MYRIKQFIWAVMSFTYKDNENIEDKYLNRAEKKLFSRLSCYEKRHAIETAKTVLRLDDNNNINLYKAALLHDIGKVNYKYGIIKKSIVVILNRLIPNITLKLSSRKNSMFYIYYNHPFIGAKMLQEINEDIKIIELVRYHHSMDYINEDMLLLKKADNMN